MNDCLRALAGRHQVHDRRHVNRATAPTVAALLRATVTIGTARIVARISVTTPGTVIGTTFACSSSCPCATACRSVPGELGHETVVLAVENALAGGPFLLQRTIARWMRQVPANRTLHPRCFERASTVGTFELTMSLFPADWAVLIFPESAVDQSQLAQLLLLVLVQRVVLRLQEFFNHRCGLLHAFFVFRRDVHVQFIVIVHILAGTVLRTFFGRTLAANADLASRISLHLFLRVASGTDN
mmetsp:Transcript_62910/g.111183  ORF Transcript_62910/g.111183 Transcript_62910/m.111183 type:complete len:242 (+) Transcript_62910:173-898(+)